MASTRYEVQHRYGSTRDGQQYGPWQAGETVELSDQDAAWVNRDSPGCLLAAGGIVEPGEELAVGEDGPERQKPAGRNRQHRGGANRSGS
jgi:hypothetical protein